MSEAVQALRIAFLDANVDAFYGGQRRMLVLMQSLGRNHNVTFVTTGPGNLSERVRDSGITVEVLAASQRVNQFGGQLKAAGPYRLAITGAEVAAWSFRFGRWLASNRVDAVVANDLRSMLLASLGSRCARVPLIWSVRDNVRQGRWHGVAARLATRIVPVSNGAATVFTGPERDRAGNKLTVIHNGVPVLEPRSDARVALRQQLGLVAGSDSPVVIHVGMLTPRKGHADWFRATASMMAAGGASPQLVVVGDEPAGYTGYRASLRVLAEDLGITDRVHWLGFREDAIDLIAGSDLLVLPSYNEGLPGVLIEALTLGIPVVSYDSAGAEEIVDQGRTGSIVPVGDIGALSEALRFWLSNQGYRVEAGIIGKRSMRDRFSVQTYGEEYERLLRAVAKNGRR